MTPETTELFWGDEADNAMQSRSSIVIFPFFFFFLLGSSNIFSNKNVPDFPPSSSLAWDLLILPVAQRVPMAAVPPFLGPFLVPAAQESPDPGAKS